MLIRWLLVFRQSLQRASIRVLVLGIDARKSNILLVGALNIGRALDERICRLGWHAALCVYDCVYRFNSRFRILRFWLAGVCGRRLAGLEQLDIVVD